MFMCKRIKFWLCKLLYSHRKKSCCISFSSKGFKVITLYRIFEGCQVEDKPIIFLPATASEEELVNAIFFCLDKSSMVIRTSINSTSAYLKFIKERSLKSYYQQSVACIVKLNVQTGIIHLELWQQADDGRGMTPCHEQSLMAFDVKGNSQLFAKYVMEILSYKHKKKIRNKLMLMEMLLVIIVLMSSLTNMVFTPMLNMTHRLVL